MSRKNKSYSKFLIDNLKKSKDYLKESKKYILIVSILFIASILFGFIFPIFFKDLIKQFVKELIEKTEGMNFWQLFFFIFENNITSAFIGLITGLLLGIFPLILCFFNGYVLGFVSRSTVSVGGFGVLWRLLPHGIFEIPALLISLGLGLRFGFVLFSKNKKKNLYYVLENSLRVFIFVVLPLLLIAGIIEAGLIAFIG